MMAAIKEGSGGNVCSGVEDRRSLHHWSRMEGVKPLGLYGSHGFSMCTTHYIQVPVPDGTIHTHTHERTGMHACVCVRHTNINIT